MELIQLRSFREVVDLGSFSRAAVKFGVTQSAVSRQVQGLERELGGHLLYRHGRGVVPTESGRKLYAAIMPLLDQLDNVFELLQDESNEPVGLVSVGVPASIAGTIGAALSTRFMSSCPKAKLQIYEGSSGLLIEWLDAGRLDMAVLYEARQAPGMVAMPLLLEDLFLVTPPEECAGEGVPVAMRELAGRHFILPGGQSGLRRVVDRASQREGVPLHVHMELHSVTTIKQLVHNGSGCTILPFGAIFGEVEERHLGARRIDSVEMTATLVCATAEGHPFTKAGRMALELIIAELRRCVTDGTLRGSLLAPERAAARVPTARGKERARTTATNRQPR